MRLIDWTLIVVGAAGIVLCLRRFSGADAISITLLIMALAIAVLSIAVGLKSVLDLLMSRSRSTNAELPGERGSPN